MTKLVLFVLGPILGVVLREVGGWAPRWADRLIAWRIQRLPPEDRATHESVAAERLERIPGDWSKFLVAAFWLGAPSGPTKLRPQRAAIALLLAGISAGGAMAALVTTSLDVPWYVAVLLGFAWSLITLNLDRFLVAEVVPIRAYSNGRIARTVLTLIPRLVFAGFYAQLVSSAMLLVVFRREIDANLVQKGVTNPGVLARLRAFEQLRHEQTSLLGVQVLLFVLIFGLELTPLFARYSLLRRQHSG